MSEQLPRGWRLWIDGEWCDASSHLDIRDPYDGTLVAWAALADSNKMQAAIAAADRAALPFRKSPRHVRNKLLQQIVLGLQKRRSELATTICREAGKPIAMAEVEVGRAISTFTFAAEECKRFGGEVIPLDVDAAAAAFSPAISLWFPRGPVFAITPFNFPLNLVAHKVAPALAVGAPVLLKPPPQAPGAATILTEIFADALKQDEELGRKIPPAALQLINAENTVAALGVSDPKMTILSFTGSERVGWQLQTQAVRKRVLLELGGNAAVVVHEDADLARAAARCAFGAMVYSGQVCISVQRIFCAMQVLPSFQELLIKEINKLSVGDPKLATTVIGPVIDAHNADRIMSWIKQAQEQGAKILTGGQRLPNNIIAPTLMTNVPHQLPLSCEEVFGPVVLLEPYEDVKSAFAAVNASAYGLQAGVFTNDANIREDAVQSLDVGGVIFNEVPTFRADQMPYGGMKASGLGREGVRYTMEEFCERKVVASWHG